MIGVPPIHIYLHLAELWIEDITTILLGPYDPDKRCLKWWVRELNPGGFQLLQGVL